MVVVAAIPFRLPRVMQLRPEVIVVGVMIVIVVGTAASVGSNGADGGRPRKRLQRENEIELGEPILCV